VLVLAACGFAPTSRVHAEDTDLQSRQAFDNAPRFVDQLPRPGFSIGGDAPVLLVNLSSLDRQVILAWKRPPGDLLTLSHAVADGRRDSCVIEWSLADGRRGSESWWLDRGLGLLVSRDGAAWLARTEGRRTWSLRCPALGLMTFGGEYDLVTLNRGIAEPVGAAVYSLVPRGSDPQQGSTVVPPRDRVYVEELAEAISKVACDEPPAARAQGAEGTVVVRAFVDTTGTIAGTIVVKSVPLLDDAAIACARQWHFKPALMNNVPVARWVAIPIRFSLR
jgi:TonB family protein